MKFNINNSVKVKLTESGVALFRQKNQYLGIPDESCDPITDGAGYTEFQFWVLMRDFGAFMGMGHELPFETTIIVEDKNK